MIVTGKGFHPKLVVVSPLCQHLFGDDRLPATWWKKYTTFSGRDSYGEIAIDDNTVKTMLNKHDQFPKQADKSFDVRPPLRSC